MKSHSISSNIRGYSQYGEDVLIWSFFKQKTSGAFFEAGANHPTALSQTYLLESNGWHGVLVEPVPECCELLRAQRPRSRVFENALGSPEQRGPLKIIIPDGTTALASAYMDRVPLSANDRVIEVQVITMNDALQAAGIEKLDFLSLDMEGMELEAMRGFDFERYQPDFILIEDRNENLDKHRFLKAEGYKLVYRKGSNNWYVPKSTAYPVSALTHLKIIRKLYVSIPFRRLRDASRKLRGN